MLIRKCVFPEFLCFFVNNDSPSRLVQNIGRRQDGGFAAARAAAPPPPRRRLRRRQGDGCAATKPTNILYRPRWVFEFISRNKIETPTFSVLRLCTFAILDVFSAKCHTVMSDVGAMLESCRHFRWVLCGLVQLCSPFPNLLNNFGTFVGPSWDHLGVTCETLF